MEKQIPMAPVVRPTMKEFENFEAFVEGLENKYSKDFGMVKVIPPKQWKARKQDYTDSIQNDSIPQPIEQNAYGKGGIYEMLHIVQKSLKMKDYRKRVAKFDNITQGKSMEQIEQFFYKNIAFSPPLYGADSRNTLFDDGVQWNLGQLPDLLKDGLEGEISGVNDPYLYVGSWKTMFAWHKEDMDLGAVNFVHSGQPKFWYAIPEEDSHYLDKMAKLYFADNFNKCPEFMRHKTTVINPYLLKKQFPECRVNKMIQREREFIVVFGGAYHHGFNYGFNIAEAVNYATPNWLTLFTKAGHCKCINNVVKINHNEFYHNLIRQRPQIKNDPKVKQFYKFIKENNLLVSDTEEDDETKKQIEEQDKEELQQQQSTKMLPICKKKISKNKKQNKTTAQDDEESSQESSTTITTKKQTPQQKKKNQQKNLNLKQQQNTLKKMQQQIKEQKQKDQQQNRNARQQSRSKKSKKDSIEEEPQEQEQKNTVMDSWLQCDSCNKWRKIDQTLKALAKRKNFYCDYISIKCKTGQQDITYTLGQQQV